jgi:small-conductance mechanosensitive channel
MQLPVSLQDLAYAAGTFAAVGIVLHVFYRIARRALPSLSERVTHRSNSVVEVVLATLHPAVFWVVALHFGLMQLPLGAWQRHFADAVTVLVLLVQLLLMLNRLVELAFVGFRLDADGTASLKTKANLVALTKLVIWTVAILTALDNLGLNVSTFVAGLGIGGIAVALAAQTMLGDAFGSFSISLDKPFGVGDFVVAGDASGTIESVGLKTTRMRALSGELIVLPNSDIAKARIRNFHDQAERRVVQILSLTIDSALDAVERVPQLVRAAVEGVPDARFDRAHLSGITETALQVEFVWFATTGDYTRYMNAQQAILLRTLRALKEIGIKVVAPIPPVFLGGAPQADGASRGSAAPAGTPAAQPRPSGQMQ